MTNLPRLGPVVASLILSSTVLPMNARAQATEGLNMVPFAGYTLGPSFVGDNFYQPKTGCIVSPRTTIPRNATSATIQLVSTNEALQESVGFQEHADAGFFGLGSVNESFSQTTGQTLNAGDTAVVFSATAQADADQFVAPIQYAPDIQELIDSPTLTSVQVAHIRDICGDRFIRTVFNERRVYVVATIHHATLSQTAQQSLSVSGSFGISAFSADASVNNSINYASSQSIDNVSINVYTLGDGGLSSVGAALPISLSSTPSQIIAALRQFISNAANARPQPVRYELEQIPHMNPSPLFQAAVVQSARALVVAYSAAVAENYDISQLIDPSSGDLRWGSLNASSIADAKAYQAELIGYIRAIASAHSNCVSSGDICASPPPAPQRPTSIPAALGAQSGSAITRLYVQSGAGISQLLSATSTESTTATRGSLLQKAQSIVPDASYAALLLILENPTLESAHLEGHKLVGPSFSFSTEMKGAPYARYLNPNEVAIKLEEDNLSSKDFSCQKPTLSSLSDLFTPIKRAAGDPPSEGGTAGTDISQRNVMLDVIDQQGNLFRILIANVVSGSGVVNGHLEADYELLVYMRNESGVATPATGPESYGFDVGDDHPGYVFNGNLATDNVGACR
ncbi:MAG: hypothetical protein WB608_14590 [Terracidiphilus sp.]